MFENKMDKVYGIHYSRYIASWANYGDEHIHIDDWLESIGVDEEDRANICNMAFLGKAELESSIRVFVEKKKTENPELFED